MAEGDDLIDEAFVYLSEKKYSDEANANRKRIIRKKAEKFVIVDRELYYYKPVKEKQVK